MMEWKQDRISFLRAMYLALTVLCIYYPITIAANIPLQHWKNIRFLALPAVVHWVFYVLLIIAIDRIILVSEKWMGSRVPQLRMSTIIVSVVVAVLAVFFSQLLFKLSTKAWSLLMHSMDEGAFLSPGQKPRLLLWTAIGRINYALTFVISISIFYLLLHRKAQARMRVMEIRAEQLEKENALAQWNALKNQVSPHFLFNSLSILSSLVHVDAHLAEKFIDRLSKAYRYILEQKDNEMVSLKTELDFLQAYAFLLKIRFENKFEVKVSVTTAEAEKYFIAPLSLQLLIENSVKHNRMSANEPLEVTIFIEADYLVVSNRMRPRSERMTSTGIGLSNIKSRYQLLTNKPLHIITPSYAETETSFDQKKEDTWFTVKIPLV